MILLTIIIFCIILLIVSISYELKKKKRRETEMLMEDRYRHNHNGNINQRMEVRLWKANKTIGVFFSCLSAVFIIGFMIFFVYYFSFYSFLLQNIWCFGFSFIWSSGFGPLTQLARVFHVCYQHGIKKFKNLLPKKEEKVVPLPPYLTLHLLYFGKFLKTKLKVVQDAFKPTF